MTENRSVPLVWEPRESEGMRKHLRVLLACVFVVMMGYGITMPVLPFYSERLALAAGASRRSFPIHIAMLTSIYAAAQFVFAPLWGRWSDKIGRRRLLLVGIAGSAFAMVLFGLSTSLRMLYAARVVGGVLSSATLPLAAAYVADVTVPADRSRGMAWLGSSISLGGIAGLALGGISPKGALHFNRPFGHLMVSELSLPFFAAAALMVFAVAAAIRWLPESLVVPAAVVAPGRQDVLSNAISIRLWRLLGLATAGQFGLTIFEGTFAVYAQQKMGYGPSDLAATFIVCGSVMAVFQVVLAWWLAGSVSELNQLAAGFALMGVGITLLVLARSAPAVLGSVTGLAMGMALIAPNLAALISRRTERVGAVLGLQSAANSLGQTAGPIVGSLLFVWHPGAPFLLAGMLMFAICVVTAATKGASEPSQAQGS